MKFMKIRESTLVLLIVTMFLLSPRTAHSQSAKYRYAYFWQSTTTETGVALIDPTEVSSQIQLNLSNPTVDWGEWGVPGRIIPSPTGEWLMIFRGLYYDPGLYAGNARTSELRLIGQGSIMPPTQGTGFADESAFYWSPDGDKYAFASFGERIRKLSVYSISASSTISFTKEVSNFNAAFSRVAWSPDSSRVVTIHEDCVDKTIAATCNATLEIWHMTDELVLEQSIDVTSLMLPASLGMNFCDFKWSPDSQYVSFVAICDNSSAVWPKEVHVWTISDNTLSQVTAYTSQAHESKQISAAM